MTLSSLKSDAEASRRGRSVAGTRHAKLPATSCVQLRCVAVRGGGGGGGALVPLSWWNQVASTAMTAPARLLHGGGAQHVAAPDAASASAPATV